jgi:hypothetical protein
MRRFAFAIIACCFFLVQSAAAVARDWTGAVDNKWATAGNWSPAGVPATGDSLTFPFSGTVLNTQNDLPPTVILTFVGMIGPYSVTGNTVRISSAAYGVCETTFSVPVQAEGDISVDAASMPQLNPNGHEVDFRCGTIGQLISNGVLRTGFSLTTLSGSHPFSGTVVDGVHVGLANFVHIDQVSMPNTTFLIGAGLAGSGTIGPLTASGWVKPSTTAATIGTIATGNLHLTTYGNPEETGEYEVDLASTGNDVLQVTGSVTLENKPLHVNLGYTPAVGTTFVIVDNDGSDAVNGIFTVRDSTLDTFPTPLQEGQKFAAAGSIFRISYIGGSGNDVVLTADAGPVLWQTSTTVFVSTTSATAGESIGLGATVTYPDGSPVPTGTITFLDGTTELATVAMQNDGASLTQTFGPGSHSITARYNGSAQHDPSTSAPKTTFMKTPTGIGATATVSGGILTVTAHVMATMGSMTPNGTMAVREGGSNILGTAPLNGSGNASLQIPAPPGVQTVNVDYLGNATFAGSTTEVTIVVIPDPTVSIGNAVASEDTGSIEVTIALSAASPHTITVDYGTTDGTAAAGADYDAAIGTVVFTPGENSHTITIDLNADDDAEGDETFQVTLSNAVGATLDNAVGTLTILDDDGESFLLFRDLQYGVGPTLTGTGTPLLLDLRTPLAGNGSGNGPFPLVVVLDAARWSQPNQHSDIADFLPARGYAVATIGFRAAPDGVFPAPIDDLKTAIAWLRTNAAQYKLNPNKMAVIGNGRGGGHLAALAAVTASATLGIDAAIVGRAATDLVAIDANNCDGKSDVATLLGCAPSACVDTAMNASPLRHASRGDAPFLLFQTSIDCGQSQPMADALVAAHVEATVDMAPAAGASIDWSSPEVRQRVVQFLDAKVLQQAPGRSRSVGK